MPRMQVAGAPATLALLLIPGPQRRTVLPSRRALRLNRMGTRPPSSPRACARRASTDRRAETCWSPREEAAR